MKNVTNLIFIGILAFAVYWFFIRKPEVAKKDEPKDEQPLDYMNKYAQPRKGVFQKANVPTAPANMS